MDCCTIDAVLAEFIMKMKDNISWKVDVGELPENWWMLGAQKDDICPQMTVKRAAMASTIRVLLCIVQLSIPNNTYKVLDANSTQHCIKTAIPTFKFLILVKVFDKEVIQSWVLGKFLCIKTMPDYSFVLEFTRKMTNP